MSQLVKCDFCATTSGYEGSIGWIHVQEIHAVMIWGGRSAEGDFCSKECAAKYLLGAAKPK